MEHSTKEIIHFVIPLFTVIFGEEKVRGEPCRIYNDPASPCPMLITNTTPVSIRLSISDERYWDRLLFQFAHEFTHYICRQYKKDKAVSLNWFEETFCEAMSLYIMRIIANNWEKCSLSQINPLYNESVEQYINTVYTQQGTDALKNCHILEELSLIEKTCEYKRSDRYYERNCFYDLFLTMPTQIPAIPNYTNYIAENKLQIDFAKWITADPKNSSLLTAVSELLPKIVPGTTKTIAEKTKSAR